MKKGRRSTETLENQDMSDHLDGSQPAIGSPVPVPDMDAAVKNIQRHLNRTSGGDSTDQVSFLEMSESSSSSMELTPDRQRCQDLLRETIRLRTEPGNHGPTNYPIHGLRGLESPRDADKSESSSLDMSTPDNSQNSSSGNEQCAIPELTTPQKPVSASRKSGDASLNIGVTSPRSSAANESDIRLSNISARKDSPDGSHRESSALRLSTPHISKSRSKSLDTTDTSLALMESAQKSGNRPSACQDSDSENPLASPDSSKNDRRSATFGLATPEEKNSSGRESADNSTDIRLNSPQPSVDASMHNCSSSSGNVSENHPQSQALSPMPEPATPSNIEASSRKSSLAADASVDIGLSVPGSSLKRTSGFSSFRNSEIPPATRGHSSVLRLSTPQSSKSRSRKSMDTAGVTVGLDMNFPENSERRESQFSSISTPDLAEPSQNRSFGLPHGSVSSVLSSRNSMGTTHAAPGSGPNSPLDSVSQKSPIASPRTQTNLTDSRDRGHSSVSQPATTQRPEWASRNPEQRDGRASDNINTAPSVSAASFTPSLRGLFVTPRSYRPQREEDILLPGNGRNSPVLHDLFSTPGTSIPREGINRRLPGTAQGARMRGQSSAQFDPVGGLNIPSATSSRNRTPGRERPSTAQPSGSKHTTGTLDISSRAKSLGPSSSLSSLLFRTPQRGDKNAPPNREFSAEVRGVTKNSTNKSRRSTSAFQPQDGPNSFEGSSSSELVKLPGGDLPQRTPKSAGDEDGSTLPSGPDLPPTRADSSSPESTEQQEDDASSPEEPDVSVDGEEELQEASLISMDEEMPFSALDTLPPPPVWFCSVSLLVYLIQRRLNKEAANVSFERFMEIVFRSAEQVTNPTDMETEENERCLNKGRGYTAGDMFGLCKRFLHKSNNPFEYYQLLRTLCPFPPLLERLVPVDRGGRISALRGIYSVSANETGNQR